MMPLPPNAVPSMQRKQQAPTEMKPVMEAIQVILAEGLQGGHEPRSRAADSCFALIVHSCSCDQPWLREVAVCVAGKHLADFSKNRSLNSFAASDLADVIEVASSKPGSEELCTQVLRSWANEVADSSPDNETVAALIKQVLNSAGAEESIRSIVVQALLHILSSQPDLGIEWLSELEGPSFDAAKEYYAKAPLGEFAHHPMLSSLPPMQLLSVLEVMPQAARSDVLKAWKRRRAGGWADILAILWDNNGELIEVVREFVVQDLRGSSPTDDDENVQQRRRISFEQEDELRKENLRLRAHLCQISEIASNCDP
mmetsp:Transcript_57414/g.186170  ORF Transcript_57414/g.186170 Transcript_57414/m.186170 type:complete len:313 (-) Transcript_57414:224-1162(-)